jgi:hypothetical protein
MDDVQYLKGDWNNRNRIKGPHGPIWLTVPIDKRASKSPMLQDIVLDSGPKGKSGHTWQDEHWRSLKASYGKARYWNEYAAFFEDLYLVRRWQRLVDLNEHILRWLLDVFGIDVEFIVASEFGFEGHKSDLVLDHCRKLKADLCVLGTHGREYLKEHEFVAAGVSFYYQDYQHPTYPQRFGEFVSHLSVVDLLFNVGPESGDVLLAGNPVKCDLTSIATQADNPREISADAA